MANKNQRQVFEKFQTRAFARNQKRLQQEEIDRLANIRQGDVGHIMNRQFVPKPDGK